MHPTQSKARDVWTDALHIVVLCSFSVAQPIYDLLGRSAEFLVAHRASPGHIFAFVAALSLGVPAILVGLELLFERLARSARRHLHLILVFGLAVAFAIPLFNRVPGLRAALVLSGAGLAGAAFTFAYARLAALRSFLTILSPSLVVFPALFLVTTPVAGLAFPHTAPDRPEVPVEAKAKSAIGNPVPIVFVVFDEFEVGALLDENKNIDSVRYPNFAALAHDAWWFPKATALRWDTPRAVPAILTGRRPRDFTAAPTLQNHPNNIFTWLGGSYTLNVTEPLTKLCPAELCGSADANARFRPDIFASDLAVLYFHIVLPHSIAVGYLPAMDAGWKGFATRGVGPEDDDGDEDTHSAGQGSGPLAGDKGRQFSKFIGSIESGAASALHFMHILLPHTPYAYLPSGAMYPGGDAEGLGEKRRWVDDPFLPTVAYHRNLLQIGFADKAIGLLVAHLKEIGLYDKALIVITADHGKSFRPGQQTRNLSTVNVSDLLQIPLFVKLPGQNEGRRSERHVINIDILPTIADVLGTKLPWASDGVSMIAPDFPEREDLDVGITDGETMHFKTAEVASYPRLAWKIKTFGTRKPWSETAPKNRYSRLLGKNVSELAIAGDRSDLSIVSDQFKLFGDVRRESGVVPALLQGTIDGAGAVAKPLHLAFVLNGSVRAVTETTTWSGSPAYFITMLPEAYIHDGPNRLDAFLIEEGPEDPVLSRIAPPDREEFRLAVNGSRMSVLRSEKRTVPVVAGAVTGYIDHVERQRGWLALRGWAIEPAAKAPASRLIVFSGDRQVYDGAPNTSRPDLERLYGIEQARISGFQFIVPEADPAGENGPIRVFGISSTGNATELDMSPEARASLDALD